MGRDKRDTVKVSQGAEVVAENEGGGHVAEVERDTESAMHDNFQCPVHDPEAWTAWILQTTAIYPMVLRKGNGEHLQSGKQPHHHLLHRFEPVKIAVQARTLKGKPYDVHLVLPNGGMEVEAVEDHPLDETASTTGPLNRTGDPGRHQYRRSESVV